MQTRLSALLAGTPQAQLLVNDFFDGGTPLVTYDLLGGDLGTPVDPNDPDGDLAPTSTPYLSAFFGINNNILNPDGNDSPGLFGASGVVLQGLHDGGVNSTGGGRLLQRRCPPGRAESVARARARQHDRSR